MPRIVSACVAAIICSLVLGCGETSDASFESMRAARDEGFAQRGWIPSFVPDDATEVRVRWNIDTNGVYGSFRFTPEPDAAAPASEVRGSIQLSGGRPSPPRWWPQVLRSPISPERLSEQGFQLFLVETSGGHYVAINHAEGRAYYWTASPP